MKKVRYGCSSAVLDIEFQYAGPATDLVAVEIYSLSTLLVSRQTCVFVLLMFS